MRYMGSKRRIAKKIVETILEYSNESIVLEDNQYKLSNYSYWVEPFVGSGATLEYINGNKIGNDSNKYIIALLKAIQNGWEPPSIVTKEQYLHYIHNMDLYPDYLIGFVGFGCSYGGTFRAGYATSNDGRNYANEAKNSLLKSKSRLGAAIFTNFDYKNMLLPSNFSNSKEQKPSIIYCDPPYRNTSKYKTTNAKIAQEESDWYSEFYGWCIDRYNEGHKVFISEYSLPDSRFKCILEIPRTSTMVKKDVAKKETSINTIEKLYTIK